MNTNNGGITNIDVLSVGALYVGGKRFRDIIKSLLAEDALEQQEIDDIRNLLTYLNTTALNQPWIINNDNRNAILKTAIDLINTKLQYLDTTALSESWVINNDNRNAILKTRIDGHDGDLSTLNQKTQYQSSVVGNNTEPRTASTFNVSIGDRQKRQLYLTTGTNFISSTNDSTNQATAGNYADNQINIVAQNGMISSIAHLNRIEAIDKIELTGFGGMGIQSSPNIIIGNKGAQIKIGSEDTPELNSTNTIISIGKRSITRNTETRLQGNIKIVDARFDELTVSSALTWSNLLALIPTNGLPLWVASAILTSAIPNYVYSDLLSMKGNITKDGDLETTTTAKLKGLSIYDSTVDIDILPKVQTFLAKGDISETTLLGNIRQQVFNGEILLRNNNIVSTNINWALTDAMDKVNALKLSNNDVELIAGAGANNSQLRISNTCTNGKIRLRMGSDGLQANAHDALAIYNDQASSQVLIAGSNVPTGYDTSSKLLVDHQNLTHGIKVTKASEALITRINHNNINTPSLTLQSNWTGTTTNTLYVDNNNHLYFDNHKLSHGGGGGGAVSSVSDMTLTAIGTDNLKKPDFHGRTWSAPPAAAGFIYDLIDLYGSMTGEIIVAATRNGSDVAPLFITTNYATIWNTVPAVQRGWISVCGSITGDRIFALSNPLTSQLTNQIWRVDNGDFGAMTQNVVPAAFASNNLTLIQIRCSHDCKYLLITEAGRPNENLCRIFKSNDFGASWTTVNLSASLGQTQGCAVSSDGKYQFVCVDGTSNGVRADTGSGGVYRSSDFGDTWTRISLPLGGQIKRVACDATGRYVMLADIASARVSRDYGTTFLDTGITLTRSCYVSNNGQFMIFGLSDGGIRLSRNYGLIFNNANQDPPAGFPAVSWDTAFVSGNASTMILGNILSKRIATYREPALTVREVFSQNANLTVTNVGNGAFELGLIQGNPWTNDIRVSNGYSVVQMNPTLANPLDINNFVYEVQIECHLTGHAPYFSISFNEVFTNLVFGATNNRHIFTTQYSRHMNPDSSIVIGEMYRDSNASWYMENAGDFTIWGYIRPLRTVLFGANGTANQNLGVLFHGQSWQHTRDNTSNTAAVTRLSHSNFHKVVFATPLIDRASNPTGLFNNINYISVNASGNAVLRNLRLRTRVHSPIDRN